MRDHKSTYYWKQDPSGVTSFGTNVLTSDLINFSVVAFVAEHDARCGVLWVMDVRVPPEIRGRGVGRSIFHTIFAAGVLLGAREIRLAASGDGASFWPAMGFEPLAEAPVGSSVMVLRLPN